MQFRSAWPLLASMALTTPLIAAHAKPAPAKAAVDADTTFPAQDAVAVKTPFATVSASDKAVTQALDAKSLANALKLVGKLGAFQGIVSAVYSPKNHDVTILDFAPHYKEAVTSPVKPNVYAKLPALSMLRGKHILVRGTWSKNAHGVAQIALNSPEQIKIIR